MFLFSPHLAIFSVMCYNVLCDKLCTKSMYAYCPTWALNWEYRKKGIMHDILNGGGDIITLQVGYFIFTFYFILFTCKIKLFICITFQSMYNKILILSIRMLLFLNIFFTFLYDIECYYMCLKLHL